MFQNNLLMAADAATSGGGAAVTSIGNSAFLNNTNSEDLSRTNDTAQTNTKKWTYSTWIYKCENPVTTANGLLAGGTGTNNGRTSLKFTAGSVTGNSTFDELKFELFNSSIGWVTRYSSMKLRDATGWYHIVLVYDAANAIAADTLIIYVNGVRAALDTEAAIPDNISLVNANGVATVVGAENSNTRVTFDGYMAETVMIDGLALTPTSFGEYDTTGLYWAPVILRLMLVAREIILLIIIP